MPTPPFRFREYPTLTDGQCLFDALAQTYNGLRRTRAGQRITVAQARRAVVDMAMHWEAFVRPLSTLFLPSGMTLEAWCREMRRRKTWGDDFAVLLASLRFQMPLTVRRVLDNGTARYETYPLSLETLGAMGLDTEKLASAGYTHFVSPLVRRRPQYIQLRRDHFTVLERLPPLPVRRSARLAGRVPLETL